MEMSILEMVGGEKYLHHDVNNKVSKEYTTLQERIEQLEEENTKLKKHNEELIALINAERERQEKCDDIHLRTIAELDKENVELKEKVSILLSCKNCPENKGGYICQKEYEDKCLAQKIQYIKELQGENAELKKLLVRWVSDKPYTVSEQKDLIADTEQFLKGD